ncbi:MAG: mechanosensitive ion channel [Acidobacteria bacterium]|nr:mechanosensitive ion channel [Acidobacteriota bacterium]
MEKLLATAWEILPEFGLKILAALVILLIGRWLAKMLRKLMERVMARGQADPIIISFVANLSYIALLTFAVLAALNQLGVQTTSFIAVIGAAGLAIGLALQGSLSNFAAGFMMIIFRPFVVGDYVEAAGMSGTVEEVKLFTTQLNTPDNRTVIIPNSNLMNNTIINYTSKGTRRVDMVFGIAYADDIDRAKAVLTEILEQDDRVLKDPPFTIGVLALAESCVNIAVRPWVNASEYFNVLMDVTETVKKRFDAAGIHIPFPQHDVHIYRHAG